jgi:hypothetical protein
MSLVVVLQPQAAILLGLEVAVFSNWGGLVVDHFVWMGLSQVVPL